MNLRLPARSREPDADRDLDIARWGIVLLAVVPIVVATVRAITGDWIVVGDVGLLALRVDDVASPDHPWLGSQTSASVALGVEVNNPGAWYQYLAAPFVALFGPDLGTPLAVGSLNLLAVVGIGVAARALGGAGCERWMLAAAAALSWSMGSALLVDLWQPHALLLPLLLLLVLAAGVATGRGRFVPPYVAAVSLIVQTHLGHAYMLVLVSLVALVAMLWARGVRPSPRTWPDPRSIVRSRVMHTTVAVAFVMWLPALIEQVVEGGEGNLSRIVSNVGSSEVSVGASNAVRLAGSVLALPPMWSQGGFDSVFGLGGRVERDGEISVVIADLPGVAVAVLGLVIVVAVLVVLLTHAHRAGRAAERAALVVAIAVVPISVVSATLVPVGPVGFGMHHVRWLWALAVFVHFVALWAAVGWLADTLAARSGRADDGRAVRAAALAPLVVLALFVVLALPAKTQRAGPSADVWASTTLHRVREQLDGYPMPEPVLYDLLTVRIYEPYSGPVSMWLGEAGVDFTVPEHAYRQYGNRRLTDGREVGTLYQLEAADALRYAGEDCVVVFVDGVGEAARNRVEAAAGELVGRLIGGEVEIDEARVVGDPRLVEVESAVAAADVAALAGHVYLGTLVEWAEMGALDPVTAGIVAEHGTAIVDWARTVYGLYLRTDLPCPG